MDPKMDSGCGATDSPHHPIFDPTAVLSAQDLCYIMDRLLALEVR